MPYVTMTAMSFGVVLSSVASILYWLGCDEARGYLYWLPWSDQLFAHPGVAVGTGALLIITGLICCPRRQE